MRPIYSGINIVLMFLMYLISLFCFTTTSIFQGITNLLGGYFQAAIAVNLVTALAVSIILIIGARPKTVIFIISVVFCLPAVIAKSNLNWFQILMGLKLESIAPSVVIALAAFFVLIGAILIHYFDKYDKQSSRWVQNGASPAEVEEVRSNQAALLLFTISTLSLPMIIIILLGFLISQVKFSLLEPAMIALIGILLVSLCVFLVMFRREREKKPE